MHPPRDGSHLTVVPEEDRLRRKVEELADRHARARDSVVRARTRLKEMRGQLLVTQADLLDAQAALREEHVRADALEQAPALVGRRD